MIIYRENYASNSDSVTFIISDHSLFREDILNNTITIQNNTYQNSISLSTVDTTILDEDILQVIVQS